MIINPSSIEFKYLTTLICKLPPLTSENRQVVESQEKNIYTLFVKNIENLIGYLITNPEYCSNTYEELRSSINRLTDESRLKFNESLETVKTLAKLLKESDNAALYSYLNKMDVSDLKSATTLNFCELLLPRDLKKVQLISNEEVRYRVMAGLINKDNVPLQEIGLTKEEFNRVLPYLGVIDIENPLAEQTGISKTDAINLYFNPYSQSGSSYLPPMGTLETLLISPSDPTELDQISKIQSLQLSPKALTISKTDRPSLEIANYLRTLEKGIRQYLVPKNVFHQLLQAVNLRICNLLHAGLIEELIFDQLAAKSKHLQRSIERMEIYYPRDGNPNLKETSKIEKATLGKHLDARILQGLQASRIPEKLQKHLFDIQCNFHKTRYDFRRLDEFIRERAILSYPCNIKNTVEVLDEEILKKGLKKEDAEFLGKISIAHLKGDRPTQQDTHIATVISVEVKGACYKIPLYGIFDGHGGEDGAKFLAKQLPKSLKEELESTLNSVETFDPQETEAVIFNTLKTIFYKLTRAYEKEPSDKGGSTACIALIIDDELWIANLGDSRAVLSVNGFPIALSRDTALGIVEEDALQEAPNNLSEKEWNAKQKRSINKRGGKIINHRVNGVLNMSRSACEIHLPAVNTRSKLVKFPLQLLPPGLNLLCIACDGAFDVLSSSTVAEKLYLNLRNGLSLGLNVSDIVDTAYKKGSRDNISALLLHLNAQAPDESQKRGKNSPFPSKSSEEKKTS